MRTAIGIGGPASGRQRDFSEALAFVEEAEQLGADFVWSAEAWGHDAVAPLAWVGARTSRIRLGTGIMQISARVPAMTAMTAMTMAALSGDRFVLGLGASGPQVVEGLHGRPFRAPLARMRETIEIVRMACAGEKIAYAGEHHQLPLPGGEGKALRLSQAANPDIPIYIASLSPKALTMTGEIADGWLGTSFSPEGAEAHLAHLRAGAEAAGRSLADLDLQVGGSVGFGDADELAAQQRPNMAFQLGAMGSPTTNFYNDAYARAGWEDDAHAVRELWVAGRREAAAERVPLRMIQQAHLLGDDDLVRERIRAYRDVGVGTLRLAPLGDTLEARLETLERALRLVDEVNAQAA